MPGKHVITLARSSIEPFLTFSSRRDLREQAFRAWASRGDTRRRDRQQGDHRRDGAPARRAGAAPRLRHLRGFQARRHDGEDARPGARPPATRSGPRRVERAGRERDDLQALAQARGDNVAIEPWDWRYYAETGPPGAPRSRRGDAQAVFPARPHHRGRVRDRAPAVRALASARCRTSRATTRTSASGRSPGADGALVGLFIGDYFARPSKRSGAWMSAFRSQERLAGDIRPIIVNVMNFAEGRPGAPELRRCPHALPRIRPRAPRAPVGRDLSAPRRHRRLERLRRTALAALRALAVPPGDPAPLRHASAHGRAHPGGPARAPPRGAQLQPGLRHGGIPGLGLRRHRPAPARRPGRTSTSAAFERRSLERIGMPRRDHHAAPHAAFHPCVLGRRLLGRLLQLSLVRGARRGRVPAPSRRRGDVFDPDLAARLRRHIYGAGNLRDPAEAYTAFRGRLPTPEALLRKRGLIPQAA